MPNVNETKGGTICWNFYKWPLLQNGPSCIYSTTHSRCPMLCSANTGSRDTGRACAPLAAMVRHGPDPGNGASAAVPQNNATLLLNRLAVLFQLFTYQLRNLRHFFAPQLQGSLLLASSIGNL